MTNYNKYKKAKEKKVGKIAHPKNETAYIQNSIYEITKMIERNELFFKRMSQHILNMRGNMYNLISLILKGEEDIPRYVLTINPRADKFNEFYHVFLCQTVDGGLKNDTWMTEIFTLITDKGIVISEDFIKTFMKIYGNDKQSPTGFADPRDSKFIREWLNAHRGKKVQFTIW